jgi:pimeloyl-ACP methyl ester carboxylesterase
VVDGLLERLGEAGFAPERVVLLGFSRGACLGLEYAARHARRYGGVVRLGGALIGPEGTSQDRPTHPARSVPRDHGGHAPARRMR